MSKYFKEHDKFFVAPDGAKEIFDHLPPGQYVLRLHPLMGFYLEQSTSFSIPTKIFGDVETRVQRVLKTYFARNCNTGVLLSGDKGSGKTMFARLLSIRAAEHGIPTVIINDNFDNDDGLNKFLSDISDRCIILFDEFEKNFSRNQDQLKILTLFDGTFQSNKLFVLTANNLFDVSEFILNRPGRVYYHFRYGSIEESFIREYCEYSLENKVHTESFVRLAKIVGKFNFDMLQALVQECNIHNDAPVEIYKMMNINIDNVSDKFSYTLIKGGEREFGELHTSIYDSFTLWWKDNTESEERIVFGNENIVRFDQSSGVFVYTKDQFTLELKRIAARNFYLDF